MKINIFLTIFLVITLILFTIVYVNPSVCANTSSCTPTLPIPVTEYINNSPTPSCTTTPFVASPTPLQNTPTPTIEIQINTGASANNEITPTAGQSATPTIVIPKVPDTGKG